MELWELAAKNDITIVTFPAHSSSGLQPADLTVFGPLKKYLKSNLQKHRNTVYTFSTTQRISDTEINRLRRVQSILSSIQQSCTFENIQDGFRKAGLFPFDMSKPLENPKIILQLPDERHQTIPKQPRKFPISGRVLTKNETKQERDQFYKEKEEHKKY